MRAGILGGSFDPPHEGHLAVARAAVEQLGLDRLLVIPSREAPHKPGSGGPDAESRLALCSVAFGSMPAAEVSRIEADRPGPSWTVDTLRELDGELAGDEVFLVLGEDAALSLGDWRESAEILERSRIAWVPRRRSVAERSVASVTDVVAGLGGEPPIELVLDPVDVSSSSVRRLLAEGRSVEGLVPEAVAREIADRGLYGVAAVGRSR